MPGLVRSEVPARLGAQQQQLVEVRASGHGSIHGLASNTSILAAIGRAVASQHAAAGGGGAGGWNAVAAGVAAAGARLDNRTAVALSAGVEADAFPNFTFSSFFRLFNYTKHDDVFPEGSAGWGSNRNLFESAPPREWAILVVVLGGLVMVDKIVLQRVSRHGAHVAIVFFWMVVACVYGMHYTLITDVERGAGWYLGYLLELILSIDNVFVFQLIFEAFRVPAAQQHKAMYFGIVGALSLRLILFLVVGVIFHMVRWVRMMFGVLLIYSGIQATMDDDESDPTDNTIMVLMKNILGSRQLGTYDPEGRMLVYDKSGRLCATMLLPIILCVEATDVIFAMDSLSAKAAQIHNQYAAFSSSAFAILALRALSFILRDLVEYFSHLKYGLCIILVFIGFELLIADFVTLPPSALCVAILAIFLISMLSSIRVRECRRASRPSEMCAAAAAAPRHDAGAGVAAAAGDDVADATDATSDGACAQGEVEAPPAAAEAKSQPAG